MIYSYCELMSSTDCIFCKIVSKEIPSHVIYETDHIFAFMDIQPLSLGHCLFIPKVHAKTANETPDEALSEILPAIKKVAQAMDVETYNILQNNGSIAHQAVMHAHWHLIPKPNADEGLKIGWQPQEGLDQEGIAKLVKEKV